MWNHSYENEFRTPVHFHANQSHFNKNGFALRLVLKQRHKGTRKWPFLMINQYSHMLHVAGHCFTAGSSFHFLQYSSSFTPPPVLTIRLPQSWRSSWQTFKKTKEEAELKKPWILMLNKKTCPCTLSTSATLFGEMFCRRYRSVGRPCFWNKNYHRVRKSAVLGHLGRWGRAKKRASEREKRGKTTLHTAGAREI